MSDGNSPNIVYFDLETQKSFEEVGGRDHMRDLRMSIGVTYSTRRGGYQIYAESQVNALIEELRRADLVVGFNTTGFDYAVLQGHNTFFDPDQVRSLDMLSEVERVLGHRLRLDDIAHGTYGVQKTSDGLQAIRWFREGRMVEIAEYCCYDVKITMMLHEFGRQYGQLFYVNRFGKRLAVKVSW